MSKHKKRSLKRLIQKAERRKYEVVEADMSDRAKLYAAYKKGKIEDSPFPEGLEPLEFSKVLDSIIGTSKLITFRDRHELPKVFISVAKGPPDVAHAVWMPWTTPREKLEIGVLFFSGMSSASKIATIVQESTLPYFERLCRYGILRKVGHIENMFGENPGTLFQAKELKTPWIKPIEV